MTHLKILHPPVLLRIPHLFMRFYAYFVDSQIMYKVLSYSNFYKELYFLLIDILHFLNLLIYSNSKKYYHVHIFQLDKKLLVLLAQPLKLFPLFLKHSVLSPALPLTYLV